MLKIKNLILFFKEKQSSFKRNFKSAIFYFVLSLYLLVSQRNENLVIDQANITEENRELDSLEDKEKKYSEEVENNLNNETESKTIANKKVSFQVEEINKQIHLMAEKNEYEKYLIEYANIFHLDSEKIIKLAQSTTNNYENFQNIIHSDLYNLDSIEAKCLTFVYLVNRNDLAIPLEDLGTSKNELLTTNEPEIIIYDHIDDLRLHDGKNYYQYVSKICDLLGVRDKKMVLAISFSEMDVNNPENASRTKNNFCGMMNEDFQLMTLPTPEAGIIAMCGNFKRKYNDYSIQDIKQLAGHYVLGNKEASNSETKIWIYNVKYFYYEFAINYNYYFLDSEKEKVLSLKNKTMSSF